MNEVENHMTKKKYAKKSALEKSPLYKLVEKAWNNKNPSFLYGYLRGMASVDKEDKIHDELMMLAGIQRILLNVD